MLHPELLFHANQNHEPTGIMLEREPIINPPHIGKVAPKPDNSLATHTRHFDSHNSHLLLLYSNVIDLAAAQVASGPIMLPAHDVYASQSTSAAPFIMLVNPLFVNAPNALERTTPAAPTYAKTHVKKSICMLHNLHKRQQDTKCSDHCHVCRPLTLIRCIETYFREMICSLLQSGGKPKKTKR